MRRIVSICLLVGSLRVQCLAADPPAIKDIRWSFGPPMRFLLKLQAQGVLGDRIVIAAGTQVPSPAGDNSTNRAWLFDPRTSAYEELPNIPKTAVAKTVGGMVGEDLYVIGTDAHATNDLLIGTVE